MLAKTKQRFWVKLITFLYYMCPVPKSSISVITPTSFIPCANKLGILRALLHGTLSICFI